MDDRQFDNLAKRVGTSRRSVLKKMVGLGGAAAVARLSMSEAEAARRGYSGKPQLTTTRFCTLTRPSCCLNCELYPWADANEIAKRWGRCYQQGYDEKVCSSCADEFAAWLVTDGFCY